MFLGLRFFGILVFSFVFFIFRVWVFLGLGFWGLHGVRGSLFAGAFAAEAGDDHDDDDDDYVLNSKLLSPKRAPLGFCCGHV